MIDVTIKNFQAEVIVGSSQIPILVDFWAPWCGPCKTLSPVLEKLEADYAGRFKLAKVNSDTEQQLAAAFGIRSIPTCILMKDGQPVDGFMGAQPERQIRQFLDKHVPSVGAQQAQSELEQADALLDEGNAEAALARLKAAIDANPADDDTRYEYIRLLIGTYSFDQAQAELKEPLAREPKVLRFIALAAWLDALTFVETDPRGQLKPEEFDALIAKNKRDFQARYDKARVLIGADEWTAAMDELLEIIMRDKNWNDQAARKLYVAILELLTPPPQKTAASPGKSTGGIELMGKAQLNQDPQLELISTYRRKLSMALN
jgi:putative thioredoxin